MNYNTRGNGRGIVLGAMAFMPLALSGEGALAHTSERGHILLLPTHLYVLGGALVVAASIVLVALLPFLLRLKTRSGPIDVMNLSTALPAMPGLLSLAFISILLAAGFAGPPDPIANPLPGAVWTLWWTGLTGLTLIFGNLWAAINPWTGLCDLLGRPGQPPWFRMPAWIGQWPAVILFFGFAWFELVYPAPLDPLRLATVVLVYLLSNFAGVFLFGRAWLSSIECFSVYFRMVAALSPLQWSSHGDRLTLQVVAPGAGLIRQLQHSASVTAFVLLALATVTFDGFMRTFFWAGQLGLNPLEYPGRSAVVLANTIGLAAMALGLALAYHLAVRLGRILARTPDIPGLVFSIVPIAFAYHLAHYLPEFPVAMMQAAKALGDPFGTGLDLFGWASLQPPASMTMDHQIAGLIYRSQTSIIVIGHVIAVIAAHAMAMTATGSSRASILVLLPLNVVMVLYTMFGLWLLSTPVIG